MLYFSFYDTHINENINLIEEKAVRKMKARCIGIYNLTKLIMCCNDYDEHACL
jgi:hypothetical protein